LICTNPDSWTIADLQNELERFESEAKGPGATTTSVSNLAFDVEGSMHLRLRFGPVRPGLQRDQYWITGRMRTSFLTSS